MPSLKKAHGAGHGAIDDVEELVIGAGRALHSFGSPAHQLEESMAALAGAVGLDGQFFSTPTAIFASFRNGGESRTHLVRVEPGQANLEKLTRIEAVLDRVLGRELAPSRARNEVDAIVAAPNRYGAAATALSFGLVSAAAARFFGGGWPEISASAAIGLLGGLLALAAERWQGVDRLLYPVAALAAASLASAWSGAIEPVSVYLVTLAGLISFVPGLTLTVAMKELATRHLVSGSSRLAGALLVFLTLGFGVGLGRHLGSPLAAQGTVVPTPPAIWTEWAALGIAALGLGIQFQVRWRHLGWVVLGGAVAVFGGRFGTHLLGPELGAFLGALQVGLAGRLVALWRRLPSALVQIPGLVLLVPGSLGFRSLEALLERDTVSGVQGAFAMILVAIALVTGLLVANVLIPPRKAS